MFTHVVAICTLPTVSQAAAMLLSKGVVQRLLRGNPLPQTFPMEAYRATRAVYQISTGLRKSRLRWTVE